jgi:hypothetical protein
MLSELSNGCSLALAAEAVSLSLALQVGGREEGEGGITAHSLTGLQSSS